jgi:hypothetical protein
MSPICWCGHPRSRHSLHSENYDAPLECDDPNCWCDGFEDEEIELDEEDFEDE